VIFDFLWCVQYEIRSEMHKCTVVLSTSFVVSYAHQSIVGSQISYEQISLIMDINLSTH
jgi:hypothetical protein